MTDSIKKGGTFPFHLVCKNSDGDVVVPTDASVLLSDDTLGTATVNADGTQGLFTSTAGAGTEQITGAAGGVASDPFPLDITVDNTIVSVEVVSDQVASVAVVGG